MSLIALRMAIIVAVSYLFGLVGAKLICLFENSNHNGGDYRSDEPAPTISPDLDAISNPKLAKKRLGEVDNSYQLEEFDLGQKNKKD